MLVPMCLLHLPALISWDLSNVQYTSLFLPTCLVQGAQVCDSNAASLWTFSPVAMVSVVALLPSGVLPDNLV